MDSSVDPGVLELGGLAFEENGLVATITLNRPETKNSQTPATWHALRIIGASLDPAVRVVVVQAAGDSFSSGLDRRMLSPEGLPGETSVMQLLDMPDPEMAESIATWQEGFTWLRRPEIVTVASVRGSYPHSLRTSVVAASTAARLGRAPACWRARRPSEVPTSRAASRRASPTGIRSRSAVVTAVASSRPASSYSRWGRLTASWRGERR